MPLTLTYIILFSIAFEMLTLTLWLIFHFKSPDIQKKMHSPRIHHSYVGAGLIALLTPFTPGSWLLPIGLVILVGKRKTGNIFRYLIGNKFYKFTRIEKILKAAESKLNN